MTLYKSLQYAEPRTATHPSRRCVCKTVTPIEVSGGYHWMVVLLYAWMYLSSYSTLRGTYSAACGTDVAPMLVKSVWTAWDKHSTQDSLPFRNYAVRTLFLLYQQYNVSRMSRFLDKPDTNPTTGLVERGRLQYCDMCFGGKALGFIFINGAIRGIVPNPSQA